LMMELMLLATNSLNSSNSLARRISERTQGEMWPGDYKRRSKHKGVEWHRQLAPCQVHQQRVCGVFAGMGCLCL
jgi:hypothetical protein